MSEVKILLSAVDEATNVLRQVSKQLEGMGEAGSKGEEGLSGLEKAVSGTRSIIPGLSDDVKVMGMNVGSAADALSAMGVSIPISPMQLFGQALAATGQFLKGSIDDTVEYAKQVRDLGRMIGASAEEASKLIQAADDMQISVDALSGALQAAVRKGLDPSVEGLGKLADEYNAIQDPIARTKFLMDSFGRSGAELAPLLEQGSKGIQALGKAAEDAGLVMDQQAVQSARNYEKALDDLNDSILATKIALGNQLLPALTATIKGVNDYVPAVKALTKAFQEGKISAWDFYRIGLEIGQSAEGSTLALQQLAEMTQTGAQATADWTTVLLASEAAMKAQTAATDDGTQALMVYSEATRRSGQEGGKLTGETDNAAAAFWAFVQATRAGRKALDDATDAADSYLAALEGLDTNIGSTIANFLEKIRFDLLGGDAIERAFEAIKQGLDDHSITPEEAKPFLRELFVQAEALKVVMGEITADQAAKNITDTLGGSLDYAKAQVLELIKLANFDAQATITLTEINNTRYGNKSKTKPGNYPPPHPGNTPPDADAGGATGLDMMVPAGYPGDTFLVGASSGERVLIQTPGQQAASGVYFGDIVVQGADDPQATAAAVVDAINRAMALAARSGAGYSGF